MKKRSDNAPCSGSEDESSNRSGGDASPVLMVLSRTTTKELTPIEFHMSNKSLPSSSLTESSITRTRSKRPRCNNSDGIKVNVTMLVSKKLHTCHRPYYEYFKSRTSTLLPFLLRIVLVFAFCLIFNISSSTFINCAPIQKPTISSNSVQHYLLKFGYLPQSGLEMRDRITKEGMKDAIRELQGFANLSQTGEMDVATSMLIKRPRCGVPDILSGQFMSRNQKGRRSKRFTIHGQKWPKTSLTWSVKRASPAHDENDIVEELQRAITVWSRSTPLKFTMLRKERADEADIVIEFTKGFHDDSYPFDGKGSILAHAFFPGTGQGGDAHFDDDEIWIVNRKSHHEGEGTRLFAVAAHEFGHSLGLSHSGVEGALMYPWYQNFDDDLRLSPDDQLGIQRIYGFETKRAPNPYPEDRNDRRRQPQPAPSPKSPPTTKVLFDGKPNTCDSSYDATSLIRSQLFIFKGRYFWRFNSTTTENSLFKGYPSLIVEMWRQLPFNLTHVDAVYEHNDVDIVFFIGHNYWRFKGTDLLDGYPKPLTSMGISSDVKKIDGAMIWGHNKKTYLFSGTQYWRLQDNAHHVFRVEPDYPRDMNVWQGVPPNIDSVLKWKDGKTYFFKGKVFWKFNDKHMRVDSETPSLSAPFWMGCQRIDPSDRNPMHETTTAAGISLIFSKLSIVTYTILCISLNMLSLTFTS